jgi:hypothetical protein
MMALLVVSGAIPTCTRAQESKTGDNDAQFIKFLEDASAGPVNAETIKTFYERAWAYWSEHKADYSLHPEKYARALCLFYSNQQKYKQDASIKIDRYESAIENFRRFDRRNTLPRNPVLFVGSSSIVFWETSISFPEYPVINRGFGAASLPEIMHYYNDVNVMCDFKK